VVCGQLDVEKIAKFKSALLALQKKPVEFDSWGRHALFVVTPLPQLCDPRHSLPDSSPPFCKGEF